MNQQVVYVKSQNPGMIPAIFGAVFGVLGIITFGAIFFWFAIACTLIGLLRGITNLNGTVLGLSVLNIILIIAVAYTSPLLWVRIAWLTK